MSNPFPLVLQPASGSVSHQAVIALLHSKMIFNVNTRERERERGRDDGDGNDTLLQMTKVKAQLGYI